MKLTKPQARILNDAVRNGKAIVGGRNIPAVSNLRHAGLIIDHWENQPAGIGCRWNITVRPTEAGRAYLRDHPEIRDKGAV